MYQIESDIQVWLSLRGFYLIKKIATVNKKGLVVAKKKGTVVIMAKAKDKSNKKGKIKIKIK